MLNKNKKNWSFTGEDGSFRLQDPELNSYLYFPLANEAGMMSSITPLLNGDIKTGLNTFALSPVSSEDLHNTKSARNFWIYEKEHGAWSVFGNSSRQESKMFDNKEDLVLEAGLLWHKLTRTNKDIGIQSEVISYVPTEEEQIELMKVTITNIGSENLTITPTVAIPIYGRSADNLRDHRHVTSLLHRIHTTDSGVVVKPIMSFDERGHEVNNVSYGVMAAEEGTNSLQGFFPIVEDYIGEGGSLYWPEAIVTNRKPQVAVGEELEGYESVGAIRFEESTIAAGESRVFVIGIGIDENGSDFTDIFKKYNSVDNFNKYLEQSKAHWDKKLNLSFVSENKNLDNWMKWVSFQPILRRIYGCSFMPHHDYGRGGRGWRDLWQDCLALILMDPSEVREMLLNNYAGVRFDGTNATIIGTKPGEFIADRNNITRVWMDHGAWPFLTTKLYIDQSGDVKFLLEEQSYFKDIQIFRGKRKDLEWNQEKGNFLKDNKDNTYKGTILEHTLVQHLTSFYNVGDHNNFKLDGADWNDALDMAWDNGESVAFTALYGSNLRELSILLTKLKQKCGISKVELAEELVILLDSLGNKVNYDSVEDKHQLLEAYYEKCKSTISGNKVEIDIDELANDLMLKSQWISEHIREKEWITDKDGYQWFNGYYDNDGHIVEGDNGLGTRMTLTGQVFTIMGKIAESNHIEQIIKSADKYLFDEKVGGYRLNTNFNEFKNNLGRAFGFAFGHKENGAMFSHMAVMYGNALYQRDYAKEGYKVISSIFNHCKDFEKSRIYPGIPEYINEKGRGMYHYLTGSASWMILTMLTEIYGVKGELGDLRIEPKLLLEQFDNNNTATVKTIFADKYINVKYINNDKLEFGEYRVNEIWLNGIKVVSNDISLIPRDMITTLSNKSENKIEVILGR